MEARTAKVSLYFIFMRHCGHNLPTSQPQRPSTKSFLTKFPQDDFWPSKMPIQTLHGHLSLLELHGGHVVSLVCLKRTRETYMVTRRKMCGHHLTQRFGSFRSDGRSAVEEDLEEDEEEEILGSDDDEQEDPKDYIKGMALIQVIT